MNMRRPFVAVAGTGLLTLGILGGVALANAGKVPPPAAPASTVTVQGDQIVIELKLGHGKLRGRWLEQNKDPTPRVSRVEYRTSASSDTRVQPLIPFEDDSNGERVWRVPDVEITVPASMPRWVECDSILYFEETTLFGKKIHSTADTFRLELR